MASKIEHLEKRIESILKNREEELSALQNAAIADRQKAEEAGKALEAATAANNIDAYRKAKAEKELASDLAELHEARRRQLAEKELVTPEEYESLRDSVLDETNTLLSANLEKAAGLIAELERIAANDDTIINRANAALLRWQEDIFRDPKVRRNGIIMQNRLAHFELSPVVSLSHSIRERVDYKQITGKRA